MSLRRAGLADYGRIAIRFRGPKGLNNSSRGRSPWYGAHLDILRRARGAGSAAN